MLPPDVECRRAIRSIEKLQRVCSRSGGTLGRVRGADFVRLRRTETAARVLSAAS
jgi:hypothetical protein